LREHFSATGDYAVAEIQVGVDSPIAGKTIAEVDLRNIDITVIRIDRGGVHIANPKGSRVIETGDSLLCYGNRAMLKNHLPALLKKRRRKKKSKLTVGEEGTDRNE